MENFSIMKILSMLGKNAESPAPAAKENTAAASGDDKPKDAAKTDNAGAGGTGNLLSGIGSLLSQSGNLGSILNLFADKNKPQSVPAPAQTKRENERVKMEVNPLISAMRTHDDFIKRVNKGQNKK